MKTITFGIKAGLVLSLYVFIILIFKGIVGNMAYYNIFILTLFLLSLPLFFYDMKRNNFGFYVFFYALLFFSFDLYKGFDMTDELYAFNLAYFLPYNSTFLLTNFVSYFLAHLLLIIPGKAYLLWERIIGASIGSAIIYLGYKIALRFNKLDLKRTPRYLFFAFVAAIGSFYFIVRFLVPYDLIPVFLSLALVYALILSVQTKKSVLYVLSGFIFVLLIYSRATMWIFSLLILLAFLLKYKVSLKEIVYFFIGLLVGFVLVVFLLKVPIDAPFIAFRPQSKDILCVSFAEIHTLDALLHLYFREFYVIIKSFVIGLIFIFLIDRLGKKLRKLDKSEYYVIFQVFVVVLSVLLFWLFDYQHNASFLNKHFSQASKLWFLISIGLLFAVIVYNMLLERKIDWFAFILILILAFASFTGSVNGLGKFMHNGMFSALIFFIVFRFSYKLEDIIIFSLLIVVFAFTFSIRTHRRYRDYYSPCRKAYFTVQQFRGIRTAKDKVYIVEQFYKKIKKYDIENYITANKAFAFSLFIDKKPYQICWLEEPQALLYNIEKYGKPKYVIFSNRNLRSYEWQLKKYKKMAISTDLQRVKEVKRILDSLYQPVVKSPYKVFVLYKLKDHDN